MTELPKTEGANAPIDSQGPTRNLGPERAVPFIARSGSLYQPHPEWTPAENVLLSHLWERGLPTQEIARRIGRSKSAVIGRAHRIGLPERPSPLAQKKRAESPKLPTLADLGPAQCRWPEGDPKHEDFHLCGEPIVEGYPYCQSHKDRAYHKPAQVGEKFKLDNLGMNIK